MGGPTASILKERNENWVEQQHLSERNAVDKKFGEGKYKYGLGRIFTMLKDASEHFIDRRFLVMNIEQ